MSLNTYKPESEVVELFCKHGMSDVLKDGSRAHQSAWYGHENNRALNVDLLLHRIPGQDRETQLRSAKSIKCNETGIPFAVIPDWVSDLVAEKHRELRYKREQLESWPGHKGFTRNKDLP